ncbi:MAG: dTMP kinase [Patescibacteria group bacterium]
MAKGKFIVFEGPDGSGQTTQAEVLRRYFQEKNIPVILTKEPTKETEAGRKLSDVLNHRIEATPNEIQELFNEDRKYHIETLILPSLNEGRIVISDRYFFSSIAYGPEDYDHESVYENFPLPDLTFILEISPEESIQRILKRGKPVQLYETKEKLSKVMVNYRNLASKFPNVHILDGERPAEVISQEIIELVSKIL